MPQDCMEPASPLPRRWEGLQLLMPIKYSGLIVIFRANPTGHHGIPGALDWDRGERQDDVGGRRGRVSAAASLIVS